MGFYAGMSPNGRQALVRKSWRQHLVGLGALAVLTAMRWLYVVIFANRI